MPKSDPDRMLLTILLGGRTWVSSDDRLWHWFSEGVVHVPSGPAICGELPTFEVGRGKKRRGVWATWLTSSKPRVGICRACCASKRLYDAGRRRVEAWLAGRVGPRLSMTSLKKFIAV